MNLQRYEVRHGKFGCYFHDTDTGVDLTLKAVLDELNKADQVRIEHDRLLLRLAEKYLEAKP